MSLNYNIYYSDEKILILYSEYIDDYDFIKNLNNNVYIFFQFGWNIEPYINQVIPSMEKQIKDINPTYNVKKNLIYCSPTESCNNILLNMDRNSIFLNHNALLDYNMYEIHNYKRKYNAVINARPLKWKRIYLSKKVENKIYIKGVDYENNELSWKDWDECNFKEIVYNISLNEVIDLYNKSNIGLMLSGCTGENKQGIKEGANYSSSEYLLCGLPVVSTISQGGRDIWYDEYNSIVCEPDEDIINNSVNTLLKKINNNEINRYKIRDNHIKKMIDIRKNYINKVQEIFNEYNINEDSNKYFNQHFYNKLTNYSIEKEKTIKQMNCLI